MTPARLAALRAFFEKIESRMPRLTVLIYSRLLDEEPQAALLFKGGIEEHHRCFARKLQSIVALTRSSQLWPAGSPAGQALIPKASEFASTHLKAGVTAKHFVLMKEAMARACQEAAPKEFTPAVAEALAFILDVLAQTLTAPSDGAAIALAKFQRRGEGTVLHDPYSYFDGDLSGESAA